MKKKKKKINKRPATAKARKKEQKTTTHPPPSHRRGAPGRLRESTLKQVPVTGGTPPSPSKRLGSFYASKLAPSTHTRLPNIAKNAPSVSRGPIPKIRKSLPEASQYPHDMISDYPHPDGVSEFPAQDIPRYLGDMSWTVRTKKEDIDSRIRTRKLIPYGLGLRGIFTWPLTVFMDVLEKIDEQARRELQLGKRAEDELLELRMRYERGEISKKEFKKKERELLKKIKAIEEMEKKERRKKKKRAKKPPKK